MGLFNSIKGGLIKETGNAVSGIIDKLVTTDKERLTLQKEIMDVINTFAGKMMDVQRDIVLAEVNGNKLQRSWRPIIMLAFGFIVIYEYFISKVFGLPPADLPTKFWDLLEIGLGGFVIGRSAEKIAGSLTNAGITLNKKSKRQ
ncbi:3TM-type holin [Labilibaculum manganireducens]|uniref:3TM-type holin n=1 Tax=Labilibaculum manganireducens TaxID=1940525 RepID=UPI0029F5168C|nr:3TM-type holin [Labilibaculum manganireducens]